MSNSVFPDLPGLDVAVSRRAILTDTIRTSVSGKEYRTVWEATPRYRYTVKFNVLRTGTAAPSPYGAFNEVTVVQSFFDTHLGSWDSFLFNDPLDGVQRRVRFEEGSLDIQRVASGVWQCSFRLISVK